MHRSIHSIHLTPSFQPFYHSVSIFIFLFFNSFISPRSLWSAVGDENSGLIDRLAAITTRATLTAITWSETVRNQCSEWLVCHQTLLENYYSLPFTLQHASPHWDRVCCKAGPFSGPIWIIIDYILVFRWCHGSPHRTVLYCIWKEVVTNLLVID